MMDERLQEQASLYVLGCLDSAGCAEIEAQIKTDAELRELVSELSNSTASLAGCCKLARPSALLKNRIMEAVELGEKVVPFPAVSTGFNRAIWMVGTVAACLVVFAMMSLRESALKSRIEELRSLTASLQSTTNDLHLTIARLQDANRLGNLRIAMLTSQLQDQPKALAVSLWDDKDQGGVIVVQHLAPLPKDADYQLWLVDPQYKNPVDGGVFQVDAEGNARIEYKARQPVSAAKAFAITKEIKGGVAVSKGPMILVGS